MIGLVLGTSEGRKILSLLNERTDDIFISTASDYGATLYSDYKYKKVNTSPLDTRGFIATIKENGIHIFIDATHPYAVDVSYNLYSACTECEVCYVRYERPGVLCEYENNPSVIGVDDYSGIKESLSGISGSVLNTTGSRNAKKICDMNLLNRIIHRVLPSSSVIGELEDLRVSPSDIVALKMNLGIQKINDALIKAYDIKAILAKDSGVVGGTAQKIEAAIRNKIKIIVIKRQSMNMPNTYSDIKKLIEYCLKASL